MLLTSPNLEQVSSRGRTPKIDWARTEEAADFAKTVKLYRQKKYDDASFRRYRLQHGAYGTRMTGDYAMIRVKIPGGRIYPVHLENLANLPSALQSCTRYLIRLRARFLRSPNRSNICTAAIAVYRKSSSGVKSSS